MRPSSRRRIGFTLPELLVVVAIISLLMVLTLSVVRAARQSANRTICVSNLRQIGMLIHSYAADNDGEIPAVYGLDERGGLRPMAWANVGVNDRAKGIGGILLLIGSPIGMASHAYTANAQLFVCPSDPQLGDRRERDDFIWANGPSNVIRRMSYVYCYVPAGGNSYPWWEYDPRTGKSWKGGALPQWDNGALVGFERHNMTKQRNAASAVVLWEPPVFHRPGWKRISFHSNGGNVLYLDGHVLDVAQHELPEPSWPTSWSETTDKISILDHEAGGN